MTQLLLLKLLLLPALMVALTLLCGMRDEYGLGLVLLSACPLAQLAFLMCHQYHTGAVSWEGLVLVLMPSIAVHSCCLSCKLAACRKHCCRAGRGSNCADGIMPMHHMKTEAT